MIHWISWMRFIAAFFIVLLHVAVFAQINSTEQSFAWWTSFCYSGIGRWGVPVFIMISGALLLTSDNTLKTKEFYYKRANRILIPICFWTIFYLLFNINFNFTKLNSGTIKEMVINTLAGRPYYHMWFMFVLAILYLFAPFIKRLVDTMNKQQITRFLYLSLGLMLINFFLSWFIYGSVGSFISESISYVPYFILGYYLFKYHIADEFSQTTVISTIGISYVIMILAGAIIQHYKGAGTAYYVFAPCSFTALIFSIYVFILFGKLKFFQRKNEFISNSNNLLLGIYLIHPAVIKLLNTILVEASSYSVIWKVPIETIVVFIISYLAVWGMSKLPLLKHTI